MKVQSDPHWRDYLLFYEYFHGDNGAERVRNMVWSRRLQTLSHTVHR